MCNSILQVVVILELVSLSSISTLTFLFEINPMNNIVQNDFHKRVKIVSIMKSPLKCIFHFYYTLLISLGFDLDA